MSQLLLLICLVLLAGIFAILFLYSHTLMRALAKTDDATFVKSFQAIDSHITNPLFFLQFFGPIIVLGIAAYQAVTSDFSGAWYVYAALASYVAGVVLTMVVNVPLNDGIKRVTDVTTAASLAAARKAFNERRWVRANHVRTATSLVATLCIAKAITLL